MKKYLIFLLLFICSISFGQEGYLRNGTGFPVYFMAGHRGALTIKPDTINDSINIPENQLFISSIGNYQIVGGLDGDKFFIRNDSLIFDTIDFADNQYQGADYEHPIDNSLPFLLDENGQILLDENGNYLTEEGTNVSNNIYKVLLKASSLKYYNITVTITDVAASIEGVEIYNQKWASKNLYMRVTPMGNVIPIVQTNGDWIAQTSAACSWYNNDSATYHSYGLLYNGYAEKLIEDDINAYNALHPHAPYIGKIPTKPNLDTLQARLGGSTVAGGALKETGTTHWTTPNTGATNSSGFAAFGGGRRINTTGAFGNIGTFGYYWGSNITTTSNQFTLTYNATTMSIATSVRLIGSSIRLIIK